MDLITTPKYRNDNDYVNDLTKEIDKHLIGNYPDYVCTYIYEGKPNEHGCYALRFPGATRGGIKVNEDNIIEEIIFFRDIRFIYDDAVEEAVKKFIGAKIIIKPFEDPLWELLNEQF
jgi:hypothetical protein